MLFAHPKRILRLDRLRLRGPRGAQDEFLLAATAQNLRKLAKLIPMPALNPRLSAIKPARACFLAASAHLIRGILQHNLPVGDIGIPGVESGYAAVPSASNCCAISAITSNASSASASVMSNEPA
jgi:hypothetical protein